MHRARHDPGSGDQGSSKLAAEAQDTGAANLKRQDAADPALAARGPIPEPVSVADNPLPGSRADTPEEALGRRTLSTAFVRVGPGERLTVELRSGRVVELRDVVMRPKDYCGVPVSGSAGARFCGGYADIASARPGGAAAPE